MSEVYLHGPSTSLCLDGHTPKPHAAQRSHGNDPPFLFLYIGDDLQLWSHEPAAFRRLAQACIQAADALEDAVIAAKADPAVSA